jgi:citrate synthase
MGALVVMLICAADVPRDQCTAQTARVVISTHIDQITCGAGAIAATQSAAGIGEREFARIRCVMR